MDKKDTMYIVGALCIILIIALVLKPAITGKPVNTGIPVATTPPPTIVTTPVNVITPVITVIIPITTLPTPTPVPTWDASVKGVQFVDPSTYGVTFNQSLPQGTRIDNTPLNTNMTSYAKIVGKYSGTTQTINIPFPSWQLVYTIEPVPALQPTKIVVTQTKGEGFSYSGIQGSYSGVTPEFTIQVMDASDPNRIVRTISPPGGIDLNLWLGKPKTVDPSKTLAPHQKATVEAGTVYVDPRPWTEKFYEGQRSYYFIIKAESIQSYSLDIKVPTQYIGKY
ncbi:MAG: hypothetical protein WC626_01545 [Methanoregula sp.]